MTDTMILFYPDMTISAAANPDTICVGASANLMVTMSDTLTPAICDDYDVTIIPHNPFPIGGGTTVTSYTALSIFSAEDEGISAALTPNSINRARSSAQELSIDRPCLAYLIAS